MTLFAGNAFALETVTAFDSGLSVPSAGSMTESSMLYPGAESFMTGGFAAVGWSVPFGVEDLAVTSFHGGMDFGRAGVSFSLNSSGFDLYGEDQEKLGLSIMPFDNLSAGVRITRNAMRIKGFGQASAFSTDLGIVYHPFETVYIAASVEDIAGAELGNSREPVDGHKRCSASWNASEQITLLCSVSKVRRFDPSFSVGFTANILRALSIGIAGGNEPDRFDFLGTVAASGMRFSYRGSHHRDLGMTHGFSISWRGVKG
ncbi:hypothetical protein ACFL6K_02315 [Candidatus Latescibacterota bacterium]